MASPCAWMPRISRIVVENEAMPIRSGRSAVCAAISCRVIRAYASGRPGADAATRIAVKKTEPTRATALRDRFSMRMNMVETP